MSVSSTDNQVIYTGSGTTGPFDFDFVIFATTDLLVQKLTIATNVSSDLTETTDYVVTIDEDGTGSVELVEAITSSYKLVITRRLPLTQEITYVENDKFPAATHEQALDRSAMRDQQLQEQLDRCVKVVAGSTVDPDDLIAEVVSAAADATAAKTAAVIAQGLAEDAKDDAIIAKNEAIAAVPTIGSGDAGKVITVKVDVSGYELKEASGGATVTTEQFVDNDLSAGLYTITGSKSIVEVRNGSGQVVYPDVYRSGGNTILSFTNFGALTSTYEVDYI